jgi:hypothetical protein
MLTTFSGTVGGQLRQVLLYNLRVEFTKPWLRNVIKVHTDKWNTYFKISRLVTQRISSSPTKERVQENALIRDIYLLTLHTIKK